MPLNRRILGSLFIVILGISFLCGAINGRRRTERSIGTKHVECPKCNGTVEEHIETDRSEIHHGLFSQTRVTKEMGTVKCLTSTCDYKCKREIHQREWLNRLRRQAATTDVELGLIEQVEVQESKDCLQKQKLDGRGKLESHPESARLQAGCCGVCPGCRAQGEMRCS
jgi:hypothetical protein